MVNSYRFKSSSPSKYRVWSPDIAREERFKRKRIREEEYIQDYNEQDRPILLIHKKHQFPQSKPKNLFHKPKDNFYKVSENTQVIDDVTEQIYTQSGYTQRQTLYHGKQNKKEQTEDAVFKVEGIEFLPEGFLELDPLQYADEYEFQNELHKKYFLENQRKLKALRRKQYMQKNEQKMRDVTIFLVDERRDKIIDYMEKWYLKNKRRMNEEELNYIADLLQCDRQTMKDLQDMFLERKKHLNQSNLKSYLAQHGKIKDGKFMIPPSLKSYFKKKNDPYSHVKPRYMGKQEEQKNTSRQIRQYRGSRPFADKVRASSMNNLHYKPQNSQKVMRKSKRGFTKTQGSNFKKGEGFTNSESFKNLFNNQDLGYNLQTGQNDNQGEQDLTKYFDSEVNRILDKIQGNKFDQMKNCEIEVPADKKIMNCNKVLDHSNQQYVENYKNKHFNNIVKKSIKNSQNGMSEKDKRIAKQLLEETNEDMKRKQTPKYKYQFNPYINKKVKKISSDLQMKKINIKEDFFEQKKKISASILIQKSPTTQDLPQRHTTVTPLQVLTNTEENEQIERVSIVSKNDNDQQTLITQKLTPQCIANEFYYQLIEDIVDIRGKRNVSVITKSERGEIISKRQIPIKLVTDNYTNKVVRQVSVLDGKQENLLIVYNDKNEAISVDPIRNNVKTLFGRESLDKRLISTNQRSSVVVEMDLEKQKGVKRVHSLPPFMIFGKQFQQKVIEQEERNKKKTIQIFTLDDKGKVINLEKVSRNLNSQMFYSQVVNDFVDEQGIRHLTLRTKNEKGRVLAEHNFTKQTDSPQLERNQTMTVKNLVSNNIQKRAYTLNPVIVGNDYVYQDLEAFVDKKGKKKTKVITKNQLGQVIGEVEIDGNQNGQKFYSEVINEQMNIDGKKSYTLVTKNERGSTIAINNVKPLFSSVLGEEMLLNFNKESKQRSSFVKQSFTGQQNKKTTVIQPVLIGNIYYQQILEEVLNEYNEKEYQLQTYDQKGNLQSQQQVDEELVKGSEFITEVTNERFDEDGQKKVTLRTLNKNKEVVAEQEINSRYVDILTQSMMSRFFNLNNQDFIEDKIRTKTTTVHTKQFRPTQVAGEQYQKLIREIIDEEGDKEVCVITQNSKGQLIDVLRVDPNLDQMQIQTQRSNRGISIIVTDSQGKKIQDFKVQQTEFKYYKNFEKTNISVKEVRNDNNGQEIITHYLKPTIFGDISYQQIVEEYFNGEEMEQKVRTINSDGANVDETICEKFISSANFKTLQSHEHINDQGVRKVVLETVNEKEQILTKLELSLNQQNFDQIFFDEVNIDELNTNEIKETQEGTNTIKKHILRPTVIGNDYYQHIVEEVIDGYDQKQKATLFVYNEKGEEVEQLSLNPGIESNNYDVVVSNEKVEKDGQRIATISIVNENEQVLAQLQQETEVATNISEYYYTDFIDIFDDNQKRQSVISIKEGQDSVFRTHSLTPTLIGGNYYQQIINEVLYENSPQLNRGTIVTCDENGQIVSVQEITGEQMGDHYFNTKQDNVNNKSKERSISLNLFNNKGQIISQQKIKPRILSVDRKSFDHNIVEVIDKNRNQSIHVIDRQKNMERILRKTIQKSKLKSQLNPIQELYETDSQINENLKRNIYFDDLVELYKVKKNPKRYTQVKKNSVNSKSRNNTFNAMDIERPKKSKPQNLTSRKFKSKTTFKKNKKQRAKTNANTSGHVDKDTLEKMKQDKDRINNQFVEKFTERKQLGKNEIELYELQRKQTELLQKLKIKNPDVELVEQIRKQTEMLQNLQNSNKNSKKRTTLRESIQEKIQIFKENNEEDILVDEKIKSQEQLIEELAQIFNDEDDIEERVRQQTIILKELKKIRKQTPEHFERIRKATIMLQQLKNIAQNNIELQDQIRKQTEYLQTLKKVDQNQGVEVVDKQRQTTQPITRAYIQNDVEINEMIHKKTIQLKDLVNNISDLENMEDVRRLTTEIQELKQQQSEHGSEKQNFQSFKESARDIQESRDAKTQFLDQTQDNSFMINRTQSEQNYNGDQKDFLIAKSEKLKGYLDDYIQTLKEEKQREKFEKQMKEKEQENQQNLRQTIEEVFKQEVDKLSDDIVAKINKKLSQSQNSNGPAQNQDLLDEFYQFCQQTLPEDSNYKESIMFVSLFYYFMEKKKLLK